MEPLNYAITKLRERFNHCENVTTYGFIRERHTTRGETSRGGLTILFSTLIFFDT